MLIPKKIKSTYSLIITIIAVLSICLCFYSFLKYYQLKNKYNDVNKYPPPVINYIKFQTLDGKDIKENSDRYLLDNRTNIIISVSGECQVIELYYSETGNESWKYQKLIYPMGVGPGKNHIVKYTWDVPKGMGYFWITAYNVPIGIKSSELIVYR